MPRTRRAVGGSSTAGSAAGGRDVAESELGPPENSGTGADDAAKAGGVATEVSPVPIPTASGSSRSGTRRVRKVPEKLRLLEDGVSADAPKKKKKKSGGGSGPSAFSFPGAPKKPPPPAASAAAASTVAAVKVTKKKGRGKGKKKLQKEREERRFRGQWQKDAERTGLPGPPPTPPTPPPGEKRKRGMARKTMEAQAEAARAAAQNMGYDSGSDIEAEDDDGDDTIGSSKQAPPPERMSTKLILPDKAIYQPKSVGHVTLVHGAKARNERADEEKERKEKAAKVGGNKRKVGEPAGSQSNQFDDAVKQRFEKLGRDVASLMDMTRLQDPDSEAPAGVEITLSVGPTAKIDRAHLKL